MKTLYDITTILEWFDAIQNDFNDLTSLLKAQRKLSILSVEMAREIGKAKGDLLIATFNRKSELRRLRREYINKGKSPNQAAQLADNDIDSFARTEMEAEKYHESIRFIMGPIGDTLNAMVSLKNVLMIEYKKANVVNR